MRRGDFHLHFEPTTSTHYSPQGLMLALMAQDAGFLPWEPSAPHQPSNHQSDAPNLSVVPLRAVG